MTLAEATIYFPIESDEAGQDDLLDLYEERLFEFKQFFLGKAIVKKVFLAKIEKLKKFEEAYSLISKKEYRLNEISIDKIVFPEIVSQAFELFEQKKSESKKAIAQAKDSVELLTEVLALIQLQDDYSIRWNIGANLEVEIEALSKEPDAMEILKAIRAFEQQGGKYFQDILSQKNNLDLMKEMKRVSLLFEKMNQ